MPGLAVCATRILATGILLALPAGCAGNPIDIENPPADADGKSRWLFVQPNSPDRFIGQIFARKPGTLGLSKRALQRDLAELDQSYRKMLIKVRMQRAQKLIDTAESSLTEIALELDYSDLAHFTRAFKTHFGYAPSRHRGGETKAN